MQLLCDMLGIGRLPQEQKRINVTVKKYKMDGEADWAKLSKWWPKDRQLYRSLNEQHDAMVTKAREKLFAQIAASKSSSTSHCTSRGGSSSEATPKFRVKSTAT